jgi:hypothetical protein
MLCAWEVNDIVGSLSVTFMTCFVADDVDGDDVIRK